MRKLCLFMMVSLDGFLEGPDHSISWHNVDAEFNDFATKQLDEAGLLLFGRVTYDLMAAFWPSEAAQRDDPVVSGKMNTMPKLVFSKTLHKADWNNTELVSNNTAERLTELKQTPGKDLLVLGSSNLCVNLIHMGLLDELRLMINPVVIGAGTPLFAGLTKPLDLKLAKNRPFKSGNVLLTYHL